MNNKRLILTLPLLVLFSGLSVAESTVTFIYDAKGRLIQVSNGTTSVGYAFDQAGNRTVTGINLSPPASRPIITSFSVPQVFHHNSFNAIAYWESVGSSSCRISFEHNMGAPYESLSGSGSLSLSIIMSGSVFLTCTNGDLSTQESIYVTVQPINEITP